MIENNIMHVALVIDQSGSMDYLTKSVVKVVDNQIANFARKSKEWNHEIRVSVYLFGGGGVKVLVYDRDVLRLPSIKDHYRAGGGTPLLDATAQAIEELRKIPEIHANHSFVCYVWTDGEENGSRKYSSSSLKNLIVALPDNYTVCAFVPNQSSALNCKQYGFPSGNIAIWDTSDKGVEETGRRIDAATDALIHNQKTGVKGKVSNLFSLDTKALTKSAVTSTLTVLPSSSYTFLQVRKDTPIKEFVESWKMEFRQGANYYQLSKPEKVQRNKHICIKDKRNGKVYSGDEARQLLGLPDYEVKINAADHKDWVIYIQSNSNNRKLIAGTDLLVMV
jgi:hypothetical protein